MELSPVQQLNDCLAEYSKSVIKGAGSASWGGLLGRDLVLAHVLALENDVSGGGRITVPSGKQSVVCAVLVAYWYAPSSWDLSYGWIGVPAQMLSFTRISRWTTPLMIRESTGHTPCTIVRKQTAFSASNTKPWNKRRGRRTSNAEDGDRYYEKCLGSAMY